MPTVSKILNLTLTTSEASALAIALSEYMTNAGEPQNHIDEQVQQAAVDTLNAIKNQFGGEGN